MWGGAAQRRNHSIWIEPLGAGRRYTDRIDIDAGWLTAIVAGFAALSDRTPATPLASAGPAAPDRAGRAAVAAKIGRPSGSADVAAV